MIALSYSEVLSSVTPYLLGFGGWADGNLMKGGEEVGSVRVFELVRQDSVAGDDREILCTC